MPVGRALGLFLVATSRVRSLVAALALLRLRRPENSIRARYRPFERDGWRRLVSGVRTISFESAKRVESRRSLRGSFQKNTLSAVQPLGETADDTRCGGGRNETANRRTQRPDLRPRLGNLRHGPLDRRRRRRARHQRLRFLNLSLESLSRISLSLSLSLSLFESGSNNRGTEKHTLIDAIGRGADVRCRATTLDAAGCAGNTHEAKRASSQRDARSAAENAR